MKIVVKTINGTNFEIEVKPEDTVVDLKRCIEESVRGAQVYPAARQMLIHQGKVLEDGTTLEENGVVESNFVVVMLSKIKSSPDEISGQLTSTTATETSALPTTVASPPPPTSTTTTAAALQVPEVIEIPWDSELYDQTTSHLVAGNNLEGLIQQLLDMGGGTWDRDTVVRAFGAAFNNPEMAVEYLYTGIPENAVVPPASGSVANPQEEEEGAAATSSVVVVPSSGPNANPLDLFPQELCLSIKAKAKEIEEDSIPSGFEGMISEPANPIKSETLTRPCKVTCISR